jgi:RHS repeat-associated protein
MRYVRMGLKPITPFVLVTTSTLLCGGPAYAEMRRYDKQRTEHRREVAERLAVDTEWLKDPRAYRQRIIEERQARAAAQIEAVEELKRDKRERAFADVRKLKEQSALRELEDVIDRSRTLMRAGVDEDEAKRRADRLTRHLDGLLPDAKKGLQRHVSEARELGGAAGDKAARAEREIGKRATQLRARLGDVAEQGVGARERGALRSLVGDERAPLKPGAAKVTPERRGLRGPKLAPPPADLAPAKSRDDYLKGAFLNDADDITRYAHVDLWTPTTTPEDDAARRFFAEMMDGVDPSDGAGYRPPQPVKVASSSLAASLADLARSATAAQLGAPVAADSAETIDAAFSAPVQALATELGGDPAELFAWVRNNIDFENYNGSAKGAEGTLLERRGNDFDQASLLIALLRASGVPARYVYGTIELEAEQAMALAGTTSPSAASNMLLTQGVPSKVIYYSSGRVTVEAEHAWVTAYVPYGNYRGLGPGEGERQWIDMDPSLKTYKVDEGVNLRGAVGFNLDSWVNAQERRVPVQQWRDDVRQHIVDAGLICPTLDDAQYSREIIPRPAGKLADTLPFTVVARLDNYATVPGSKRHTVRLSIPTPFFDDDVATTVPLAQAWGKKLALRWKGSSQAAQDAYDANGPFGIAGSTRVVPSFWLDETELAAGSSWTLGESFELIVQLTIPGYGTDTVDHDFESGAYHVVQVSPSRPPAALLARADGVRGALAATGGPAWKIDEAGLWRTGLRYHQELYDSAKDVYGINRQGFIMDPLEALLSRVARPTGSFGFTTGIRDGGYNIDASKNTITPFGRDGSAADMNTVRLHGYSSSGFEHRVWEEYVGADGLSAVKALQLAKAAGQPVYTVRDAFEWQAVRSGVQLAQSIEDQIGQFVAAGYEAIFHRSDVNLRGWTGAGYILFHPLTGEGRYLINGTNGGDLPPAGGLSNFDQGGEPCAGPPDPPYGSTINPASGRFAFDQEDIRIPSDSGTVQVRRSFSSEDELESALGPGFVYTFDQYIDLSRRAEGIITFWDDNAQRMEFSELSDGSYLGPPGRFTFIRPRSNGEFLLTFSSSSYLVFNAEGRITKINRGKYRNAPLTITRDANGLVDYVSDVNGAQVLTMTHDADGRLLSIADRANRIVSYDYDGSGRLTSATGLEGAVWSYGWSADDQLTSKTSPLGDVTSYFYDPEGRSIRAELPDGGQRTLAYDPLNRRTIYTDATGRETIYAYNEFGAVTKTVDPAGTTRDVDYDQGGCMQTVTDGRGNETVTEYDTDGNLVSQTQADGVIVSYERDSEGRLTNQTKSDGSTVAYEYDAMGNLTQVIGRTGGTLGFEFDDDNRVTGVSEGDKAPLQMAYDQWGNAAAVTTEAGETYTQDYDAAGRVVRVTGADDVVDYETDERGLVTKMTSDVGWVEIDYDEAGRIIEERGSGGQVTEYGYDAAGNLTHHNPPHTGSWSSVYDEEGRRTSITDPRGNTISFEYDEGGAVRRVVDREGNVMGHAYCADEATASHAFNPFGGAHGQQTLDRACVIVDGTGAAITRTFDHNGDITGVVTDLGTSFELGRDSSGNVTRIVDELGRETQLEYDELNQLTRVTDALGGETAYTYDEYGNRTSITDPAGRTRTYVHDDSGRLVKKVWPDGTEEHKTYNQYGNEAGWGPALDRLNQVVATSVIGADRVSYWDAGGDDVYTRNADGSTASAMSRDVTLEYLYTIVGRGAGHKIADVGNDGVGIEVEYDLIGNPERVKLTNESEGVRYYYDKNERPSRIVTADGRAVSIGYDGANRITEVGFPNGLTQHTLYDERGAVLSTITLNGAGAIVAGFSYEYDAASNRTRATDHTGKSTAYTYDALNRLTRSQTPGRDETFTYDGAGNRLTRTLNGETTTYSYDAGGRVTQENGPNGIVTYGYDDEGRLQTKTAPAGTTAYAWDARGVLTQVTLPSGKLIKYGYGADKNRIWREEDGQRVYTLWYEGHRFAEVDGDGDVVRRFLPGPADGLLFGVDQGTGWNYAHTDALRSVTHFTDDAGNVVSSFSYDPFGAAERTSGGVGGPAAMFTGVPYDEAVGVYATRMRVYDPFLGRFHQRDPHPGDIDKPKTLNPYVYALNNPTLYVDRGGGFSLVDTIGAAIEIAEDPGAAATKYGQEAVEAVLEWVGPGWAMMLVEFLWKLTIWIAFWLSLVFYNHYSRLFIICAAIFEDESWLIDWAIYTWNFFIFFIKMFTTSALDMMTGQAPDIPEPPDDLLNGRWWCVRGLLFCFIANMIIEAIVGQIPDIAEDIDDPIGQWIATGLVDLVKKWAKWMLLSWVGCPDMGEDDDEGGE